MSRKKWFVLTCRVGVTKVGGLFVHCSGVLSLQAESLADLSPGRAASATPWVIPEKILQPEGLTAIVPDSRLAVLQTARKSDP